MGFYTENDRGYDPQDPIWGKKPFSANSDVIPYIQHLELMEELRNLLAKELEARLKAEEKVKSLEDFMGLTH